MVVELRDVDMSVLFGERSFVSVDRMSGGLGGHDGAGGKWNAGVTLWTEWTTGEGVEETGSMAIVRLQLGRDDTRCDDTEFHLEERFRRSFYDKYGIGTAAIEMDPS